MKKLNLGFIHTKILILFLLSIIHLKGYSQGDACTSATNIPIADITTGSYCNETANLLDAGFNNSAHGVTTCNTTTNDDYWWEFTATGVSGTINIEYTNLTNANKDIVLEVFERGTAGACTDATDGLYLLQCTGTNPSTDLIGKGTEAVNIVANTGSQYFIRVRKITDNVDINGSLCVYVGSPIPDYDLCQNALPITMGTCDFNFEVNALNLNKETNGTEALAELGTSPPTVVSDAWLTFTADFNGKAGFSYLSQDKDAALFIYSGSSCGNLSILDYDEVTGGQQDANLNETVSGEYEYIEFEVTNGTTYYVRVANTETGTMTGQGCLYRVYGRNDCANAEVIPSNSCNLQVNLPSYFTQTGPTAYTICSNVSFNQDIWLKYTITAPTTLTVTYEGDVNNRLVIYQDACTPAASTDDGCSDLGNTANSLTYTAPAAGTYLIRILADNPLRGKLCVFEGNNILSDDPCTAAGVSSGTLTVPAVNVSCNPQTAVLIGGNLWATEYSTVAETDVTCEPALSSNANTAQDGWVELDLTSYVSGNDVTIVYDNNDGSPSSSSDVALEIRKVDSGLFTCPTAATSATNINTLAPSQCSNIAEGEGIESITFKPSNYGYTGGTYPKFFVRVSNLDFNQDNLISGEIAPTVFGQICAFQKTLQQGDLCTNAFPVIVGDCDFDFGWGTSEFFNHPPVSAGGFPPPTCDVPTTSKEDGWFTFTAVSSKTTIEFQGNKNVRIEVYRGTCGSLNKSEINNGSACYYLDVATGALGEVNLNTITGENYFIRVVNQTDPIPTSSLDAKLCIYETVAQNICDDISLVTKTVGTCNIRFNLLSTFTNNGPDYNPDGGCASADPKSNRTDCSINGSSNLIPSYPSCDGIPTAASGFGSDAFMRFIGNGEEVTIQYESLEAGDDPAIVVYTKILGLGPVNCGVGLNGAGNNGNEFICADDLAGNTSPHTEAVTFKTEAGQLYIVRIIDAAESNIPADRNGMRGLLCITEGNLTYNDNTTPLDINHINNQDVNVGVGECNQQMTIVGNGNNTFSMSGPSLIANGGTQTSPSAYYGSISSGGHGNARNASYAANNDEYLQVGYSIPNFDITVVNGNRYIAFIPTTTSVIIRYEDYQSSATNTERPVFWYYHGATYVAGFSLAWNQWGEAHEVQLTGLTPGDQYSLRIGEASWHNGSADLIGGTLSLTAVGTPTVAIPSVETTCLAANATQLQYGMTVGSDLKDFEVSTDRYVKFIATSTNTSAAYYNYGVGTATIDILDASTCTSVTTPVTAGGVGQRAEVGATGLTVGNNYIVHISGGTFTAANAGRLVVYNTDDGAPADAWAVFTTTTTTLGYTPLPELITVQYDNDNNSFATDAQDVILEVYKADSGNLPLGTPYENDLAASPTLLTPTINNTGATGTSADNVVEGIEQVTFDASTTENETFYVRVIHKKPANGSVYGTVCTFYGETIAGGPDCYRSNEYAPLEGQWQDFNVDASWHLGTDNQDSPFGTTMTDPPCVIPNDGRPRAPETNPIRREGWIKFTVPSSATWDRVTVQYDNVGFNNGVNPPNAAFAVYTPINGSSETCLDDVTELDSNGDPIAGTAPSPCADCEPYDSSTQPDGLFLINCVNNVWEGTETLTLFVDPGRTYWVRVMNVSTNTNTMQGRIRVYPFVECTLGTNLVVDGDFENWRKIQAEVNDKISGEWYYGPSDPPNIPDFDTNPNQNQGRYIHSNPEVAEIDYFQLFATEYGYLRDVTNTSETNENINNQYKNLWESRWELNPEGLYCVSQSPWSYKGDWSCYGVGYTGYGRNNNSSYCQSGGAGFGEDACIKFGSGTTYDNDPDATPNPQKYNFNLANGNAQTHWPAPIPVSADANHMIINGWWNRSGGQVKSGRVWCQTIDGLTSGNVEYFIFSAYFQNMIQIDRNLETPQMRFTICDMMDPDANPITGTPATLPGTTTITSSGLAPEGTLGLVATHNPPATGDRTSPSPAQPAYGAAMPCNTVGEDKDHRIKVLGSDFFINESPDQWMVVKCIYRKPQNVSNINICIENLSLTKNGNDFGVDQISFQRCEGISGLNNEFERLLRGDACEISDNPERIGIPLGINFLEFSGFYNGKNTLLSWTTIEEENTKKFIVQRSDEGRNFYDIGEVKANGNTNNLQGYSFTDTRVPENKEYLYYRLLIVGANGDSRYSSVVRVHIPQFEQKLKIVPNPTDAGSSVELTFTAPQGNAILTISDIMGNRLMKKDVALESGLNSIELSTQGLKAGVYIINIKQGDNRAAGKLVVY